MHALDDESRIFLVIGCGSIGKRHIANLIALKAGEIVAFDVREDRREEVKSKFGVNTVDNLNDAWKLDPRIALIAVSTNLHVSYAIEAAKRGCHLFIEKPLSDCMEGVDELLEIVARKGLITLVGCNMRFHPGLMTVKRLLGEKAIGRVVTARAEFGKYLPDWHPWEDYRNGYSAQGKLGGGVILDAIHEIDYIRWMIGEVEAVSCFAGKLSRLEIDTEDTAAIILSFNDGTIGEIHLDYVQRTLSRGCQIVGDEGTIRWDFNPGGVDWYSAKGGTWQVLPPPTDWNPNQMYVDEMIHFLRCVDGEEKPALDVNEGARVLQIALAAKLSAETRKFVGIGN